MNKTSDYIYHFGELPLLIFILRIRILLYVQVFCDLFLR